MPTSLPPAHEPKNPNLDGLGVAVPWAGFVVVLGMFIAGVIYWSGHTRDANATGAPALQTTNSSAAVKTTDHGSAVQ
jgi:hypothetical protein